MAKYRADFYATAPTWGPVNLEDIDFDSREQFEFAAKQYVQDLDPEITDIDIKNIEEIV